MFPHVKDGGLYMCEDCHTSYWEKYGGGLNNPASFIEFSKRLIDELNAFHAGGNLSPTYNTRNMGGLHFYSSMVVVEKQKRLPQFSLKIGKPTTLHFADAL